MKDKIFVGAVIAASASLTIKALEVIRERRLQKELFKVDGTDADKTIHLMKGDDVDE